MKVNILKKDVQQLQGRFQKLMFIPNNEVRYEGKFIFIFDTFSIETFNYFRVIRDSELLLTSEDINFNCSFESFGKAQYSDKLYSQSLLKKNLEFLNSVLKDCKIEKVILSDTADLFIIFENKIEINMLIDCFCDDFIYYKIILPNNQEYLRVSFKNAQILAE